jgi:transcriptional regulator with XRE-family HTH domain
VLKQGEKFRRSCSVRRLTRLREERQRSRLTQEELANISGVNRVTIARLETGAARAKPETTDRLARTLKVKPEDLIEDLI